ncbi:MULTISPECIES: YitT family protein [Enterococcus]|uniref:YitT family protein n=1 Tax=Enterococcus TaxID=1350 RepID=UPI0002F035D7|nr:YitT family protein [Enterococcus mundtii]MDB7100518.1 YitT family protein [Enterococcus mundtii]
MKNLFKYLTITLGLWILSISINMFFGPHYIAAGGTSGLGILLEYLVRVDRSLVVLALNSVMLLLAIIYLGKQVFMKVLYGSLVLPLLLTYVPKIMFTENKILSIVLGSLIFSVGMSIVYSQNSSSGGTSIPPIILKKYFNIKLSTGLFFIDGIVILLNWSIFGFDQFLLALTSNILVLLTMNLFSKLSNKTVKNCWFSSC